MRSPVVQFLVTGLLTCGVLLVGTGVLSSRAARDEALKDAIATTEVLARSVAEPAVPARLVDGDPGRSTASTAWPWSGCWSATSTDQDLAPGRHGRLLRRRPADRGAASPWAPTSVTCWRTAAPTPRSRT